MACCCCISDEPVQPQKPNSKIRVFDGPNRFQVPMMDSPCVDGISSFGWFCGQCFPLTCGITQYLLRRKVLGGDMSKYICCQGYVNCCCFGPDKALGEGNCPDLCLCLEAHILNSCAVSFSRIYVMDKYQLSSDPCDYRLIRINNCIVCASIICDILGRIYGPFGLIASILDLISEIVYHIVSGCMTAQTAHEVNYQGMNVKAEGVTQQNPVAMGVAEPVVAQPVIAEPIKTY